MGGSGAVSVAEALCHQVLTAAGVTGWVANAPVRDGAGLIGVVDLLFSAERVVVEVDGRMAHSSREAFQRDRQRWNRLQAAGYTVVHVTWWDLTNSPAAVVTAVRRALNASARRPVERS